MSNVPQDVLEDALLAGFEVFKRPDGSEGIETFDAGENITDDLLKLLELRAQRQQGAEPDVVYVADYTLVRDVAKMYGLDYNKLSAAYRELLRAQRQQCAEPVASGVFSDLDDSGNVAKRLRRLFRLLGVSTPESDESLLLCSFSLLGYACRVVESQPPQANALVAAAYRKAAGICDDSHVSWDVHRVNDDTLWNNACTTVKSAILAAVPADAEAALHERDFALCMKAAVEAYIAGQEHGRHGKTADLDAIVNGVLGEGGE